MGIHTVASAIIGAQKIWARKPADFYPTPYDATQVLLDFLQLPPGTTIWEPAAGEGDMAAVMEANGLDVSATDLRRTLFLRKFGHSTNFLTYNAEAIGLLPPLQPDWIISNPPFKLATEFIGHALTMTPNVAMLLKSQFWHARRRIDMFERRRPAFVCPLTWRPSFLEKERGNSPLMDVIWVIWKGQANFTEFVPLRRPTPMQMAPIRNRADRILMDRRFGTDFDDVLGPLGGDFNDILG